MTLDAIELLVDRRELVVRGERAFPTREVACTSRWRWTMAPSNAACASWSTSTPNHHGDHEAGMLE